MSMMENKQEPKKARIIAFNMNAPKNNSPDWLRTFKGCEHYNDADAMAVLDSLDILAAILLGNASHKIRHIDNQQIVSLYEQEEIQKIAA